MLAATFFDIRKLAARVLFLMAFLFALLLSRAEFQDRSHDPGAEARALFLIALTLVFLLLYRPFFSWVDRRETSELPWSPRAIGQFAIGTVFGAGMLATPFVFAHLHAPNSWLAPDRGLILLPLSTALYAAVHEEILFRGFLQQLATRWLHPAMAVPIVALLFMPAHVPDGRQALGLLSVLLGGLIFGAAFYLYRNLWLPIGLHFGFDFLLMWQPYLGQTSARGVRHGPFFDAALFSLYAAEAVLLVVITAILLNRSLRTRGTPAQQE